MGLAADIVQFFDSTNVAKSGQEFRPRSILDFTAEFGLNEVSQVITVCRELKQKGHLLSFGFHENHTSIFVNERFTSYFDKVEAEYGVYDFIVGGFYSIREHFSTSVIPIEVTLKSGEPDIGTGFLIEDNRLVTCRHCIENMTSVKLHNIQEQPKRIVVPSDKNIDLAIIEFRNTPKDNVPVFKTASARTLDQVMVMGYPSIPGYLDTLVTETAQVSSIGQFSGDATSYHGNHQHMLITARVKGGNSGGPVISEQGKVVGIIFETDLDEHNPDLMGYAFAIHSQLIQEVMLQERLPKDPLK